MIPRLQRPIEVIAPEWRDRIIRIELGKQVIRIVRGNGNMLMTHRDPAIDRYIYRIIGPAIVVEVKPDGDVVVDAVVRVVPERRVEKAIVRQQCCASKEVI